MNLDHLILEKIDEALQHLFQIPRPENVRLQPTNKEFEGTHTLVCFPLTKLSKRKPEETASLIGEYLIANSTLIVKFNVVKGFLNLVIDDREWIALLKEMYLNPSWVTLPPTDKEIMVEYSSPNTNKPLHLGHLRNNFLGWSVSEILKTVGYRVHRVQIINDRGIHICKSMAAWQLYGEGETPASSGIKGDHLVGKYYVAFDKAFKAQVYALVEKGMTQEQAEKEAPIMQLATELLLKWEQKDPDTLALWEMMNGWVYEGFKVTYEAMGVDFDKLYYESDTYLIGKQVVQEGLERGVFYQKDDGSIWVDLSAEGLDEKLLIRADGTSVYMTQDIGTAILRFNDFPKIESEVYTVGNEQEYHFKVLFLILDKLAYPWAKNCYHLSYGMVDLPSGKMKSREGTVVDADDLMLQMIEEAENQTRELGKIEDLTASEAKALFEMIGLGALKFFLLKVDPKKRMLFDPEESIQLQGFTGPFVQYTYARIRAILRKAESLGIRPEAVDWDSLDQLEPAERDALQLLNMYEAKIQEAAREYSPAVIANYVYDLAKEYNQFYQLVSIFNETNPAKLNFRIAFSATVAGVIKKAMGILGISVPNRM